MENNNLFEMDDIIVREKSPTRALSTNLPKNCNWSWWWWL